jgi:MFS family permease
VTRLSQNKNLLLFIVCLAQFMVILDVSIVNVALPDIGDSLSFSTTGLEWVVNAYTLTFSGLLMLGGRAADLLGGCSCRASASSRSRRCCAPSRTPAACSSAAVRCRASAAR